MADSIVLPRRPQGRGTSVHPRDGRKLPTGRQEFVMRGNLIGRAVALAIGAVFSSAVNSVVSGFTIPLVGAFGTKDPAGYSSCPKEPCTTRGMGRSVVVRHIPSLRASCPGCFRGGAAASR